MLFSSIPFLFYFLTLTVLLYAVAPKKLKNSVLLLASLVFYGWGEPKYLLLMAVSILLGYIFGLLIARARGTRRAKAYLIAFVVISLALLGYFKYADFFISGVNFVTGAAIPLLRIALPIGISFYTFQLLSYVIDVYRGEPEQKSLVRLACYIAMFPQLIAGPIVRYSDIAAQLERREHTMERIALGCRRFVIGLGKKILLANALGELCDIFRASEEQAVLYFWLYAVAFTLHIYFDFSGYSDMAIGLGRIFGFELMENFNYPYISGSITEFWRRWHMSLSSWFRDYVYIPLGGNRVTPWRQMFNLLAVWMLTGLWHGAAMTFVVWGLYFAVLLIIEKRLLPRMGARPGPLRHLVVLLLVCVSFVIFNAADLGEALHYIGAMFGVGAYPLVSDEFFYYLRSYAPTIIIASVGATPLVSRLVLRLKEGSRGARAANLAEPVVLALLVVMITAYLVDGSFNPFLYFRF